MNRSQIAPTPAVVRKPANPPRSFTAEQGLRPATVDGLLRFNGLVRSIALRLGITPGLPVEDSEEYSDGWFGLMQAWHRHPRTDRPGALDSPFPLYAARQIRSEILDGQYSRGKRARPARKGRGKTERTFRQYPLLFADAFEDSEGLANLMVSHGSSPTAAVDHADAAAWMLALAGPQDRGLIESTVIHEMPRLVAGAIHSPDLGVRLVNKSFWRGLDAIRNGVKTSLADGRCAALEDSDHFRATLGRSAPRVTWPRCVAKNAPAL